MYSRKETEVATRQIRDDFGYNAQLVFETIARRENSTFDYLRSSLPLKRRTCGNILYTLLKHGCVKVQPCAFQQIQRETHKKYIYGVDLAYVNCRRRFSRYILYTEQKYGAKHAQIVLTVLLLGTVSFQQLMLAIQKLNLKDGGIRNENLYERGFVDLTRAGLLCQTNVTTVQRRSKQLEGVDEVDLATHEIEGVDYHGCFWRINPRTFDDGLRQMYVQSQLRPDSEYLTEKIETHILSQRQKYVEAIIRCRLGPHALRIYRLLSHSHLEQKQIAELSMVPIKDTRDILYKLLKFDYVRMQELARTHDHAPSRTNYLWRANPLDVEKAMKKELVQTLMSMQIKHSSLASLCRYHPHHLQKLLEMQRGVKTELRRLEFATIRLDMLLLIFDDITCS